MFKRTCAKIVIPFDALRVFKLSRSLNARDFWRIVFQVMPHHKRSIIRVRPRADPDRGELCGFKRPFNGITKDAVRIHSRTIASVGQKWLHWSVENKVAFSVCFIGQIGKCITHCHNNCAAGSHPPRIMRCQKTMRRRSAVVDFFR